MQITLGNTIEDGAGFSAWFTGDLEHWASERLPSKTKAAFGLRQTRVVEMKWGEHRSGEVRAGWAACSERTTMSLLLRGKFLLRFRFPAKPGEIIERRLERAGDYAIWGTDVEHTWIVEEDATIFTVRWIEK